MLASLLSNKMDAIQGSDCVCFEQTQWKFIRKSEKMGQPAFEFRTRCYPEDQNTDFNVTSSLREVYYLTMLSVVNE